MDYCGRRHTGLDGGLCRQWDLTCFGGWRGCGDEQREFKTTMGGAVGLKIGRGSTCHVVKWRQCTEDLA